MIKYTSPNQLELFEFEQPFGELDEKKSLGIACKGSTMGSTGKYLFPEPIIRQWTLWH